MDYMFNQERIETARERQNRLEAMQRERENRQRLEQAMREEENDSLGAVGQNVGLNGVAEDVGNTTSFDGQIHPVHTSTPQRTNQQNPRRVAQSGQLSNITEATEDNVTREEGTQESVEVVVDESTLRNVGESATLPIEEAERGAVASSSNVTHPVGQLEHEINRNRKNLSRITKQIHDTRKELPKLTGRASEDKQLEVDILSEQRNM